MEFPRPLLICVLLAFCLFEHEVNASFVDKSTNFTGASICEDFFVSVRKPRAQNRSVYDTREDSSTALTLQSRKKIAKRCARYSYDAMQRVKIQTTSFGDDILNRLARVTTAAGDTTYSYDAVGNRAAIYYPNGTEAVYTYDDLYRLAELTNRQTLSGNVITQHNYTLGLAGNRTQMTEATGRVADYTYDDLYRLTAETITDATLGNRTSSYLYDATGNRQTRTVTCTPGPCQSAEVGEGTTTYTYDVNDRLLTEINAETTTYTYDDNGNTTAKTTPTEETQYTWNSENRLSSAQAIAGQPLGVGIGQVSYQYDDAGIRQTKSTDGIQTSYLIDPNQSYQQVLEELDATNTPVVLYVYGDDLISQTNQGQTSFYHYDGLGSTRALTDSTGTDLNQYVYEAFGETENQTGSADNSYLYTGEQFDLALNNYYLRARYYAQGVGRFQGMDSFSGSSADPRTLHKYVYVQANSINGIDPSGYLTMLELATSRAVLGTLLVGGISAGTVYFGPKLDDRKLVYLDFAKMNLAGLVGSVVGQSIVRTLETAYSSFGVEFRVGIGRTADRKASFTGTAGDLSRLALGDIYGFNLYLWSVIYADYVAADTERYLGPPVGRLSDREIGVAIGNVAAHELGHSYGVPHISEGPDETDSSDDTLMTHPVFPSIMELPWAPVSSDYLRNKFRN